jgi:hypothetical protein
LLRGCGSPSTNTTVGRNKGLLLRSKKYYVTEGENRDKTRGEGDILIYNEEASSDCEGGLRSSRA